MTGERVFAGLLGLLGLGWLGHSLSYRYWGDFAPGSGFLPFWLGGIMAALVVLFLIVSFRGKAASSQPQTGLRKPALIMAGLAVCIGLIDTIGFLLAISAYLVWLFGAIERRTPGETLGVGIGAPVVLYLIFRVALKVPLPEGPWGF